jgi:hypothetical protein
MSRSDIREKKSSALALRASHLITSARSQVVDPAVPGINLAAGEVAWGRVAPRAAASLAKLQCAHATVLDMLCG